MRRSPSPSPRQLALLIALVAAVSSSACSSQQSSASGAGSTGGQAAARPRGWDAPEWVMRTPRMKGNICAVSAVDPTFFRQDGLLRSSEAARGELARTIQVKVTAVMIDEQTARGSSVEQTVLQEVVGSISDVVLAGAQVMESWFDEKGSVSRKGMTYALACMPTDQSVAQLAEKLKEAAPPSEDQEARLARVRDRAKAAFEELEAAEDKKATARQ